MLSSKKSDFFDNESDDDDSDSGSAGTCAFPFRFEESIDRVDNYIGHVCGVGSGVFVPIGIKSISDVVLLVVFVPIGVNPKGGRLIEIFWRSKS